MKIPCVQRIPWLVSGLSFLLPILTPIQFVNLTLIATALVLGSRFKLTEISLMWLKRKAVSTLSYFFSDAKLSIADMQRLYLVRVLSVYNLDEGGGYFIIDDTMKHHTNFCRWIHGVCCLFDHALHTNMKAVCIVFLYYSDGGSAKFPVDFRIFYKEDGSKMPWQKEKIPYKNKNQLALEMIGQALKAGFPKALVLADSWFCVKSFVQGLRKLELDYVLEMKSSNKVRVPCRTPRLTPGGRLAKKQFDPISLAEFFQLASKVSHCGFEKNLESGKEAKVLYHLKTATARLNAFDGKHRLVHSFDPVKNTVKYFLANQLHWEARKIVSVYSNRWVIEEFFRNAKQLSDMEGACLRSEQGVTLSLCLVSWIDFLLHHQNYRRVTVGLSAEPISVQSIIRQAQADNMEAFIEKVQGDEIFVQKWIKIIKEAINRPRKVRKELVEFDTFTDEPLARAG